MPLIYDLNNVFHRILVDHPARAEQRFFRAHRDDAEADNMVAHEVMPGVGLRPERQAAHSRIGDLAQQLLAGDLLFVTARLGCSRLRHNLA